MTSKKRTSMQALTDHSHSLPKIQTMEELRLNLYAYKILDICWFEEELPLDPDTRFGFNINPAWPDEWEFPGSINGITHLSKEELQFITRRLKRPAWVREIEMISLSQILDSIFKHRSDK